MGTETISSDADEELARVTRRGAQARMFAAIYSMSVTATLLIAEAPCRAPPFQNIPWAFARGMLGAIHGAESVGSPTSCRVSQCSTA
jgi:hypothetical protein